MLRCLLRHSAFASHLHGARWNGIQATGACAALLHPPGPTAAIFPPGGTGTRPASSKSGEEVSGSTHFSLIFRKKVPGAKPRPKDLPVYSDAELDVTKTHYVTIEPHAKVAFFAVKCLRMSFDIMSRYRGPGGGMTKNAWLQRCIFLETVAGIPGFVAGMHRHLSSIGSMRLEQGQISTLFEEAENERMHLLIFMSMKRPGRFFRFLVTLAQGVFFNLFFFCYLLSQKTCHRFVGYLEEEAVHTYSGLIQDLEKAPQLQDWAKEPAALIGRNYFKLPKNATVLDIVKCVRTDESHHRDTNHEMANSKSKW